MRRGTCNKCPFQGTEVVLAAIDKLPTVVAAAGSLCAALGLHPQRILSTDQQ
jgi:hypothetical protein